MPVLNVLAQSILDGEFPMFIADNCAVVRQRIRATGATAYREMRPFPLKVSVDDLTPFTETMPAAIDSTQAFKTQRAISGTLNASVSPAALATLTVDLGSVVNGAAADVLTPASVDDDVRDGQNRRCLGVIVRIAIVAPDTAAGGYPAQPGVIQIVHTYGKPAFSLYTDVMYSLRILTCRTDTAELFMPFIGGDSAVGDFPFMQDVPAFYAMASPTPFFFELRHRVTITTAYNLPVMRISFEPVYADALLGGLCDRQPLHYFNRSRADPGQSPPPPPPPPSGGGTSGAIPVPQLANQVTENDKKHCDCQSGGRGCLGCAGRGSRQAR